MRDDPRSILPVNICTPEFKSHARREMIERKTRSRLSRGDAETFLRNERTDVYVRDAMLIIVTGEISRCQNNMLADTSCDFNRCSFCHLEIFFYSSMGDKTIVYHC